MIKSTLIVMLSIISLAKATITLDGSWNTISVSCSGATQLPQQLSQMLKTTQMIFQNGILTQSMMLLPNCFISSTGAYQLSGNSINFGVMKSTISATCPAGISVTDKQPSQGQISGINNQINLQVSGAAFCKSNENLILSMQKSERTNRRR